MNAPVFRIGDWTLQGRFQDGAQGSVAFVSVLQSPTERPRFPVIPGRAAQEQELPRQLLGVPFPVCRVGDHYYLAPASLAHRQLLGLLVRTTGATLGRHGVSLASARELRRAALGGRV